MDLQRVTNHPVHIVDENGQLSPTALVPFCSISNNFSAMGIKIDQFDVPVCTVFRKKLVRDQICYTLDLNQIRIKNDLKEKVVHFSFFIDYNEDRELSILEDNQIKDNHIITLETIGKSSFKSL